MAGDESDGNAVAFTFSASIGLEIGISHRMMHTPQACSSFISRAKILAVDSWSSLCRGKIVQASGIVFLLFIQRPNIQPDAVAAEQNFLCISSPVYLLRRKKITTATAATAAPTAAAPSITGHETPLLAEGPRCRTSHRLVLCSGSGGLGPGPLLHGSEEKDQEREYIRRQYIQVWAKNTKKEQSLNKLLKALVYRQGDNLQ
uniref:Uncharacterized protein n=1 Tax=Oryza nivara TaxID=4536 RepID=A0A0E0GUX5_ORYNI